ncbi:enoyl-CoA hydratase/isomerase [Mycobacteroides abscessus]|uniref:enoyl-CoA hydratase/isomerase family protein n=2 Tax=Mycobacteroides abscessus TaxID=36809 RepID=UPI0005DEFFBF|nr:enoyl-CoA hydratase-related protein [Mycobacteroides abscessus]CPT92099.1 enoyl-CoA hydratase/isomerase [Mycobacteroides abscessus]CPW41058.1 enoyl-CoA hydratase/isomerase [Mycobacteroides abscessus]
MLNISDEKRVRTISLARVDALNAFNEALYDATAVALREAADDDEVSVVVLTGSGRAFCAGTDLKELRARASGTGFTPGEYGFEGLMSVLTDFHKPLICAVNGVGLGIGTTILGFADLAFMSTTARLKCPFTSLGLAPEASSSYLLPALIGRQNAAWVLLSSEWIDAQEALDMGLVWRLCEPEDLMAQVHSHAQRLASHPLSSLMAVKRTITAPHLQEIRAALEREATYLDELLGAPDNAAALERFVTR